MRLAPVACYLSVVLAGCASSSKPEPALSGSTSLTLAETESPSNHADHDERTAADRWAEKKIESEVSALGGSADRANDGDPLAMGTDFEESAIPEVKITPKSQVRYKGPAELHAALSVLKDESSVEGAANKLAQRLGKPSWIEIPKGSQTPARHVWVAAGTGGQCHRLILEADGSAEIEPASRSEWRLLTASARQNPCTGEVRRGLDGQ